MDESSLLVGIDLDVHTGISSASTIIVRKEDREAAISLPLKHVVAVQEFAVASLREAMNEAQNDACARTWPSVTPPSESVVRPYSAARHGPTYD